MSNYNYLLPIYLICALLLGSCKSEPKEEQPFQKEEAKPVVLKPQNFDFNVPTKVMNLSSRLLEISGMTYDFQSNSIYAINDEKGVIYKLDTAEANIIEERKFGKKGDYEGIAKVEDTLVVVKQNGHLFFYDEPNDETQIFKTQLKSKNDIEGAHYDEKNNCLLLAAKGQTLEGSKDKHVKAIYDFDLEKVALKKAPYLIIQDSVLTEFVSKENLSLSKSKLKKLLKRIKGFSPSGISMNPKDQKLYVLSARGSTLVIFDHEKKLNQVVFLEEAKIPQPEGICFGPDGEMFISTEGKGLKAKIFRFQPL